MIDEMTPDEFDLLLDAIPVEIEVSEPGTRFDSSVATDIIVQPEIARALVEGTPIHILAQELGVSPGTIRRRMRTMEMRDLIKVEARRLIRHLSRRPLEKEKYLGLATALSGMIHDTRLLDNEPTEIHRTIDETTIQNITIGLFGRSAGERCKTISRESQDVARRLPEEIHEESAGEGEIPSK